MVGRNPNNYEVGLQKIVNLPIFLVKYQPIIPKGAKRTFHDGSKLHRLTNTTISHGLIIFEEDFEKCKEQLQKSGYEKIKAEQMTHAFPKFCPKCGKDDGNPILRLYDKVVSGRYDFPVIEDVRYELHYNHSKPKYHQCYIGMLNPKISQMTTAQGIDPRKMSPFYILRKNEILNFDLPKKKKPNAKDLT